MNSLIPWILVELEATGDICPNGCELVPVKDLYQMRTLDILTYLVRPAKEVAVERVIGFQPDW